MKKRHFILILYAIEISSLLSVSFVALMVSSKADYNINSIPKNIHRPIEIEINQEKTTISDIMRQYLLNSVQNYMNTCPGYDILRPITLTCYNQSGLSTSLISSLDSVYLAKDLEMYNRNKNFLKKYVFFNMDRFVRTKDMMEDIIGGLISMFSLTSENYYHSQAVECADLSLAALRGSVPFPLFNPKTSQVAEDSYFEGTSISDASSFIVEMSYISEMTRNSKYIKSVSRFLKCIKKNTPNSSPIPEFWKAGSCSPIKSNETKLTSFNVLFYSNILRLHKIKPDEDTQFFIDHIKNIFNQEFENFVPSNKQIDAEVCGLLPLLEVNNIYGQGVTDLSRNCEKSYSRILPPQEFHSTRNNQDGLFLFESSAVERQLLKGKPMSQLPFSIFLENAEYDATMCALSSQKTKIEFDYLPVSAISKWGKYLMLDGANISYDTFVFSNAGHIIPKIK